MLKKNIQLVDKQNSKPLLPASPDSLTELWKWEEVREVHKGSGMMDGFTRCEQNSYVLVSKCFKQSFQTFYLVTCFLTLVPRFTGSTNMLLVDGLARYKLIAHYYIFCLLIFYL